MASANIARSFRVYLNRSTKTLSVIAAHIVFLVNSLFLFQGHSISLQPYAVGLLPQLQGIRTQQLLTNPAQFYG